MTEHEFKRRFPNASQSAIARNCAEAGLQNPQSEQNPVSFTQSPIQNENRSERSSRVRVIIESFRSKLCDVDNLSGGAKFLIDGLRYHHLISDDSPEHIELVVTQRKVKRAEECTIVRIEPI